MLFRMIAPATTAAVAGLALMSSLAAPARAQGASPEVVARLQSLLQEATRARARLERDNARLTSEVEALENKVAQLEGSQKRLQSDLASSRNRGAALEEAGQAWRERYYGLRDGWTQLLGGCTESVYRMRDIERERADFVDRLAARNASLRACATANEELLALNEEILARYEKDAGGGPFGAVAKHEPFLKLSRVQLENAVDDYRYRAGDSLFVAPDDIPLIDEEDGAAQTIDGRWECRLLPLADPGAL